MTSTVDLSWQELKALPPWTPTSSLTAHLERVSGDLFRLRPEVYLVCVPHNQRFEAIAGETFVVGLLWAPSDGAARRAQLMEIEADDAASGPAPREMLPEGGPQTYGGVVSALKTKGASEYLESASYRIGNDGAFVHRTIEAPPFSFFFRTLEDDDSDPCYAVQYRLVAGKPTAMNRVG